MYHLSTEPELPGGFIWSKKREKTWFLCTLSYNCDVNLVGNEQTHESAFFSLTLYHIQCVKSLELHSTVQLRQSYAADV